MTICALEFIINNNIEYDNLIKISGRYWLSDNFDYSNFNCDNIVIKYINDDKNNAFTALYQLPKNVVIDFKIFLENNLKEMVNCIGYEVLFANFLKKQNNSIKYLNPIGLEGYVSVCGTLYNG